MSPVRTTAGLVGMKNWLQEFHEQFPEATERYTGVRQRLDRVEELVAEARRRREVASETISAIEEAQDWTYPTWWPRLSATLESPIVMPSHFNDLASRRDAVRLLHDRLQHIEVTSVVLRFLVPEEFAIISPPVCALLKLAPLEDHVSHYLAYLALLRELGRRYALQRVADVDMALWCAAHAQADLPGVARRMHEDEDFQETRLRSMMSGLGRLMRSSGGRTSSERLARSHLIVARAAVKHDHLLAAVLAARAFEVVKSALQARWGVRTLKVMGNQVEFAEKGYRTEDLQVLRVLRNSAVQPSGGISKKDAERFVKKVSDLAREFLED